MYNGGATFDYVEHSALNNELTFTCGSFHMSGGLIFCLGDTAHLDVFSCWILALRSTLGVTW